MSLFEQWKSLAEQKRTEAEYDAFWKEYFLKEKAAYEKILENQSNQLAGKVSNLAENYGMDTVSFTGFIDGINTSLKTEIELETLTEDAEITMVVELEKLFYNMLAAKADWLYTLPQWEQILTEDERHQIKKKFNKDHIATSTKVVGRNDVCPCGSGKKYKKCCLA